MERLKGDQNMTASQGKTLEKVKVKEALYQAYLLRLWRESEDQPWRATIRQVEEEYSGLNFSDPERAFAFLRKQLDEEL